MNVGDTMKKSSLYSPRTKSQKVMDAEEEVTLRISKVSSLLNSKRTVIDRFDRLWMGFFRFIPIIKHLFVSAVVSHNIRLEDDHRNISSAPVYGMLSIRTLLDTITFRWLKYLDLDLRYQTEELDENACPDLQSTIISEQSNLALLSALIFTVWSSFLQQATSNPLFSDPNELLGYNDVGLYYVSLWTGASMCTAMSCVLSVFFMMAVKESTGTSETRHFINVFHSRTFGVGLFMPLALFYAGMWFGVIGFIFYIYLFFQGLVFSFAVGLLTFLMVVFGSTLMNLVASLLSARKSAELSYINREYVVLTENDLHILIENYAQSCRRLILNTRLRRDFIKVLENDVPTTCTNTNKIDDTEFLISCDHFIRFITIRESTNECGEKESYHVHLFPKSINRIRSFYKNFSEKN
jgi:hypothetical protein